MGERVFQDARLRDEYRWVYRDGKTFVTKVGDEGIESRSSVTLDELTAPRLFIEVTPDLPPTTADLSQELEAYKQFYTAIKASYSDPAKRNHQLDYQHAYDELRRAIPTKGSEALQ